MTEENVTDGVAALLDPKTDYYRVFADVDGEDLEWWKKALSLIHISEPTRLRQLSRMPSSA